MKVLLLYSRFLDDRGDTFRVGGIETYLRHLAGVVSEDGGEPIILQCSQRPFRKELSFATVIGVPVPSMNLDRNRVALFNAAQRLIDWKRDVLVFGGDHHSVHNAQKRCISIQHGVAWDLPARFLTDRRVLKTWPLSLVAKRRAVQWGLRSFERVRNVVCVDYNFTNWYRTLERKPKDRRVWVIPNATELPPSDAVARKLEMTPAPIHLLFARRFTEYRGVDLFATAVKELSKEFTNLKVTFAGEGPLEGRLRDDFASVPQVAITKFGPDQVVSMNLETDIAVVPSLASEGTSLSVAEAMGAGSAVVATAVGGITNMLIDGFNGRLIQPDARQLTQALRELVRNPERIRMLGRNAHQTALAAFSLKRWRHSWLDVINEVASE